MKKLLSAIVILSCITVTNASYGITQQGGEAVQDAATAIQTKVKASEFRGVITKIDNGTALQTETEIYPLLGGNFETIVGKKVLVVGRLVTEDEIEKISVARVQFAKQ